MKLHLAKFLVANAIYLVAVLASLCCANREEKLLLQLLYAEPSTSISTLSTTSIHTIRLLDASVSSTGETAVQVETEVQAIEPETTAEETTTISEDITDIETTETETTTEATETIGTLTSNSAEFGSDLKPDLGSDFSSDFGSDLSSDLGSDFTPDSTLNLLFSDQATNNTTNTTDSDSIDECHFMSFEEWKKQKQADAENIINSTSAGNDSVEEVATTQNSTDVVIVDPVSEPSKELLSPDDQGRVYKDKFNYASVDCAATIVKTNLDAKGASAILVENKDSYLINKCASPNKFVVIELCQDILVENVVVGNFEFFSSMFKDIKISVSDRFPVSSALGWKVLGEFEALNMRDVQTFSIENPLIWARYLKLEILSHYGDEFYCPISLLRVHGKTMMDDFKMAHEESENGELVQKSEPIQSISSDLNFSMVPTDIEKYDSDFDDCKAVLPHLRLNEFLNDINSTEWCDAPIVDSNLLVATAVSSPTAKTATQESIYKNIMKRLSLLESNATLSLLYVEEQSKLLSTAFSNSEKRQANKFDKLVENFNRTMVGHLNVFKTSYYAMQQEAINLFITQQRNHDNLLTNSNKKLALLTSELSFQKKIAIFNSLVTVCLLIYVVVGRDGYLQDLVYFEEIDNVPHSKPRKNDKLSTPMNFPVGFTGKRKANTHRNVKRHRR